MLTSSANVFSQLIFSKKEYAERREKLMDITQDGIAIIWGAIMPVEEQQFRQYNNIMYFAGTEIPDVILVIDGEKRESYLFFSMDEKTADSENISLELVRNPEKVTGIEHYLPYEQFTPFLTKRLTNNTVIYTPFKSEELIGDCTMEKFNKIKKRITSNEWDGRLSRELQFVKLLSERFPANEVVDCSPYIWNLRKIKSTAEVDMMRRAGQLGAEAHKAVMKATKPGTEEKKLAALFNYVCYAGGAKGMAFNPIIMSAEHHAYGHYHHYDRTLADGDFIILDAGPDVEYYDTDISTTFPANGKFSEKQKEIYEFALEVRQVCLDNYHPGITLADVGNEVRKMLEKKGYDTSERRIKSYIRNGVFNHSIGMAVHDKLDSFDREKDPLQVGFVFACDIMARADSVTSVRIEDMVVITEEGCEILSAGLPRSVEEIETFMKK